MSREELAARIAGLLLAHVGPTGEPWYDASPADLSNWLADNLDGETEDGRYVPVPRELLRHLSVKPDTPEELVRALLKLQLGGER